MSADPFPQTGFADGERVQVTFPAWLVMPASKLTPRAQTSRILDALALRVCCGFFSGSLRALATANEVTVQALSKRAHGMARAAGIELHFCDDHHRAALSRAHLKRWERIKAAAGTNKEGTP